MKFLAIATLTLSLLCPSVAASETVGENRHKNRIAAEKLFDEMRIGKFDSVLVPIQWKATFSGPRGPISPAELSQMASTCTLIKAVADDLYDGVSIDIKLYLRCGKDNSLTGSNTQLTMKMIEGNVRRISIAKKNVPIAPKSVISPPTNPLLEPLFTADDYPWDAFKNGWKGEVVADLIVGRDGRVRQCSIFKASGYDSLDKRTCDVLIERARFAPARDANGNPVEDTFRAPVIKWKL